MTNRARALLAAAEALGGSATHQISLCVHGDLFSELVDAGGKCAVSVYQYPGEEPYALDTVDLVASSGVSVHAVGPRRSLRKGERDRVPSWNRHSDEYFSGRPA